MTHSTRSCFRNRVPLRASFLLGVVICALSLVAGAFAKPVTYMFVVQRTPDGIDPFGDELSPSGWLVTPSGIVINFGPPNGEVIITLIFEGNSSDAVPYSIQCGPGCGASGSEIAKGTAGFMITDAATGNTIAQGTFLPSAGMFVSIDRTNGGAGIGSYVVTDTSSPALPGQPTYPWALDNDNGALGPYDLRSDFVYGLWAPDLSYGSGVGRVPGHSCVDFPVVSNPCGDPLPLPTTAGTLYFDAFSPEVRKLFSRESFQSLQLRILCLGFFQDGNVGIGVFPEGEEILISGFGFSGVTRDGVRLPQA